ncbi:aurora kinase A- and ninein-interacting protein [Rattus norvegicus]|uniref:Aurora kinase A- and ninein-interacting protein n=1 Tax=Rattus norvegicus TaxID=10116 RepID=AUNIP_RAT|nr:aurora kinase A- and ninein-interacting protein [Rattus norvegicus]D3ZUC4.1 RecName: Full=Aurora kinase A- and ninein-interacting protein [Rattus norvegicus]|eukprot:XP_001071529.1 PREDICTED: aurora kinase A and ninein-interacting protein isoform X2 [Rattus norvegicus]
MSRRGPEEEACGVWLDAAALKRQKMQTHLLKLGTKMLTLLPGERKPSIPFTQRRATRQTSITSFVTSQPGMANGGNQKNASSLKENQINRECKSRSQLDCLDQGLEDDCLVSPLATSTPADIREAGHSPQSSQISGCQSLETTSLTMMSFPQPVVLMGTGESKAPLASSFTQFLERSCLLDQREAKRKREGLCGSKTDCPGMGSHIRPPGGKCHQPLDKAKVEKRATAKENRQAPVHLQTYRFGSHSGKKTLLVTKSPCPLSVFSWDIDRKDRDSWSQLFTEDSQGHQVIAHSTKMPFQDVTNARNQGSGQFPDSPQAQGQDGPTLLHLQPHLLFTQDSEGNRVIRH